MELAYSSHLPTGRQRCAGVHFQAKFRLMRAFTRSTVSIGVHSQARSLMRALTRNTVSTGVHFQARSLMRAFTQGAGSTLLGSRRCSL